MRKILAIFFVFVLTALAGAAYARDVYVNGHTRKDGTYVQPHYRSNPDGNFNNNWSTKGNVNPYTGKAGTKSLPSYGAPYGGGKGAGYGSQPSPKGW